MKKHLLTIITLMFSLSAISAQSWVDIAPGAGTGADLNLIFDTTSNQMFLGCRGSNQTVFKTYLNSTWDTIGLADFSGSSGYVQSPHFIQGDNNEFYVAFSDNTLGTGKLSVMHFDGTSWNYVGPPRFTANKGYYPSLIRDASGTLFVGFQNGAASNKVSVMKFDGSNWAYVGGTTVSGSTGNEIHLGFDAGGVLHVVHRDFLRLVVKKLNAAGASWSNATGAPYINRVEDIDMTQDAQGNFYIIYSDLDAPKKATVVKYNGTTTTTLGAANFTPGQAKSNSIKVSKSGVPYVAFADVANGNKLSVMQFNGTSWNNLGPAGFTGSHTFEATLSLDTADVPHVAYYSQTSSGAAIKKYSCVSNSNISPTACGQYTSPSGNYTWTSTATYQDTLFNANSSGCDSIITINLTINNNSSSSISPTACGQYTSPSGNYTWTSTATYQDTLFNANSFGCDSIITVNLTINPIAMGTDTQVACNSYTWTNGQTYTSDNITAMDTIVGGAANG
ncbi:MAG: hypothetical protein GY810_32255, partial [Aureispira sp.]|nr:hypothetical protein [Aureispira sp.]